VNAQLTAGMTTDLKLDEFAFRHPAERAWSTRFSHNNRKNPVEFRPCPYELHDRSNARAV